MYREKNPLPDELAHLAPFPHLNPEFPLKSGIEPGTDRSFRVVSLPQQDGSYVASIVEAPVILFVTDPAGRQRKRLSVNSCAFLTLMHFSGTR